jgi:hypothetical protein
MRALADDSGVLVAASKHSLESVTIAAHSDARFAHAVNAYTCPAKTKNAISALGISANTRSDLTDAVNTNPGFTHAAGATRTLAATPNADTTFGYADRSSALVSCVRNSIAAAAVRGA